MLGSCLVLSGVALSCLVVSWLAWYWHASCLTFYVLLSPDLSCLFMSCTCHVHCVLLAIGLPCRFLSCPVCLVLYYLMFFSFLFFRTCLYLSYLVQPFPVWSCNELYYLYCTCILQYCPGDLSLVLSPISKVCIRNFIVSWSSVFMLLTDPNHAAYPLLHILISLSPLTYPNHAAFPLLQILIMQPFPSYRS